MRQLRLRDVGGIIVIDFIDMANPKNRKTVEDALREELERDRTKTYVVEISPLGLVEMTRQNVTEGPREVMTRKCPTCGGDGIVLSEASAAIDMERRLRALVAGSRSQAFKVELAAPIASALVGPGARRLIELEALTKRRFFLEGKPDMHLDHFVVLAEGKLADLTPPSPVAEGAELQIELVEVDRHDATAAVGKLDGIDVCVGDAAQLVGKRVKVRVERVLDGTVYASLTRRAKVVEPLTAEAEAEKPTRKPPVRKDADAGAPVSDAESEELEVEEADEAEDVEEVEEADEDEDTASDTPAVAAKKTRRGSRGGRNRKKPTTIHLPPDELGGPKPAEAPQPAAAEAEPVADTEEPEAPETAETPEAPSENGAEPRKKKTRRGSRGGKNRRKKPAGATATVSGNGSEPVPATEPEAEPEAHEPELQPEPAARVTATQEEEWGYVPMSEWGDEIDG